jgi:DNA-binding NarL/FixJ family response regulator
LLPEWLTRSLLLRDFLADRKIDGEVVRERYGDEVISDGPISIRILSVDDHPLVREGISGLVAGQSDMNLVGEATNGREAIQQFRKHRPDDTRMDTQMPEMNGVDAIIAIRNEFPDARIIVLTTYVGMSKFCAPSKLGRAYLLKSTLHKELLDAIRAVHAGKKTVSPKVSSNSPSTPPMTPWLRRKFPSCA